MIQTLKASRPEDVSLHSKLKLARQEGLWKSKIGPASNQAKQRVDRALVGLARLRGVPLKKNFS